MPPTSCPRSARARASGQPRYPSTPAIKTLIGADLRWSSASVILDVPVDDGPPRALGAQNHLDRLPKGSLAPAGSGDEVDHGLDLGRRVSDGDGKTGPLQRGQVEEIVAHIGDPGTGAAGLGS